MATKRILIEIEIDDRGNINADPNSLLTGLIEKLGDGEITYPMRMPTGNIKAIARIVSLKGYTKSTHNASW